MEASQALAFQALVYMLDDEQLRARFLNLTGLDGAEIHQRIHDPAFQIAILDFFLDHEPDLLAFCEARDITPDRPAAAKMVLLQGV